MCLAIPMKVKKIDGKNAEVEIDGVSRHVDVSLVEAEVGDYVIVHAGFAIEKMKEEEARKTLDLFKELEES